MASTSTRNLTALRASLKHEDAAIENRIPTAKLADPSTVAPAAPGKPPGAAAVKANTSRSTPPKAATPPSASAPVQAKTAKVTARPVAAKPAAPKAPPKPAATKPIAKPVPSRVATPASLKSELPKGEAPRQDPLKAKAATAEAKLPKREAEQKLKPSKPVKNGFSMSKTELAQLKSLRTTLGKNGVTCTKSDLLRAGLGLLLKFEVGAAGEAVRGLAPLAKSKKTKKG